MKKAGGYYTIVIEDEDNGKIVGLGTLFVEMKFIRSCGKVNLVILLFDYVSFMLVIQ
jgi:hypothetical protein